MRLLLTLLLLPLFSYAFDDSPRCLRQTEIAFIDQNSMLEAFDLYRVLQSQWNTILTNFAQNVQLAPDRIRERARALRPNPFEYPFDKAKVKEIILQVEFEVFRDTLVNNYVYDIQAINGMFAYIRQKREAYLDACLSQTYKRNLKR